jgi:hypothetical protein
MVRFRTLPPVDSIDRLAWSETASVLRSHELAPEVEHSGHSVPFRPSGSAASRKAAMT